MAGFGGTKEAVVIWFDRGDSAALVHEKVSMENALLLGSFFGTERFHSFTNVTASRLLLVMASLLSALDFTAP